MSNNEGYETLVSMGFPAALALKAMKLSGGDLDSSINLLLSGSLNDDDINTSEGRTSEEPFTIQTSISQYAFSDGVSACSCIALNFASEFFTQADNKSLMDVVTPEFLTHCVTSGVEKYKKLGKTSSEHKSPEQILGEIPHSFNVSFNHDMHQGVLSSDDSPLGLKQVLNNCRMGGKGNDWVAVVITKTPETVCVCIPNGEEILDAKYNYILFDSHPRPQMGSSGCYARFHSSIDDLLQYLKQIFPITNVEGMGLLMTEMYNSFDAYPLHKPDEK